ncbi:MULTISPECIES: DUF2871 family protein [unclassified Tessaracoccus]|uniref:DUF2871 family protein n=1 Tax=unclassified Tessaracoccus TaxID=2635419 RepID=UPI001602123F|nr:MULTISPECIES: DUF2871 family protein [unclassified Tessaracoccus]MBB1514061.1 DUF2871 domain-containing protein [Tessaracoccus sp. MC1627]MBB1515451.1 DUF2871 domain-containing protein [Tessaracoccus sp. MC1679]
MLNRLFFSAATWTALGLASGLYWREMTKLNDFTGHTQLATAHTHALALGTLMLLVVLALAKSFALGDKATTLFTVLWNVGLGLTFGAMIVKGTLQVLEIPIATSPMWAGIAGLGHMVLSGTFVYLFVILRRALTAAPATANVGA